MANTHGCVAGEVFRKHETDGERMWPLTCVSLHTALGSGAQSTSFCPRLKMETSLCPDCLASPLASLRDPNVSFRAFRKSAPYMR
jgi:hypothetical protein